MKTMHYVISDIHGCYEEYQELLKKIRLKDSDTLYVLGDIMDRGPEPIKVIMDMMLRPNVFPILGNHDYMALIVLEKLNVEMTQSNLMEVLDEETLESAINWMSDGGDVTIGAFRKLDSYDQEEVLEYLNDCVLYEEIKIKEKTFVLVHADIHNYVPGKKLDDYDFSDLIFHQADYGKRYFKDKNKFLITGHTPVMTFRKDKKPLVYEENGHIAIDCGCVYGGQLAAYCLETGKTVYVKSRQDA